VEEIPVVCCLLLETCEFLKETEKDFPIIAKWFRTTCCTVNPATCPHLKEYKATRCIM